MATFGSPKSMRRMAIESVESRRPANLPSSRPGLLPQPAVRHNGGTRRKSVVLRNRGPNRADYPDRPSHRVRPRITQRGSEPSGIVAGPGWNIWFTESARAQRTSKGDRRRITPTGVVTEFRTGLTSRSEPFEITVGSLDPQPPGSQNPCAASRSNYDRRRHYRIQRRDHAEPPARWDHGRTGW